MGRSVSHKLSPLNNKADMQIIRRFTPTSVSADIAMPLPGARIGSHHSLPDPRWCAQASRCDDKRAPKDSSVSSPPASNSDLHPATCKTAVSLPRAYLHYTQYLIHYWRNAYFGYLAQFARAPESLHSTPPPDPHSIFHSQLWELQYECLSYPVVDQRSAFDTWSPWHAHRYKA